MPRDECCTFETITKSTLNTSAGNERVIKLVKLFCLF